MRSAETARSWQVGQFVPKATSAQYEAYAVQRHPYPHTTSTMNFTFSAFSPAAIQDSINRITRFIGSLDYSLLSGHSLKQLRLPMVLEYQSSPPASSGPPQELRRTLETVRRYVRTATETERWRSL